MICLCKPEKYAWKARSSISVSGRKIGSTVKRLMIGSQKHGQRPAPALGHDLGHELVDLIQIGTLFSVDLDVDEIFIHQLCDFRVFKALMSHDMAPVAGGIADTQKNGLVFVFCAQK